MFDAADIVVQGSIISTIDLGSLSPATNQSPSIDEENAIRANADAWLATVRISVVYKGRATASSLCIYFYQTKGSDFVGLVPGENALLFLRDDHGRLRLLDTDNGKIDIPQYGSANTSGEAIHGNLRDIFENMVNDSNPQTVVAGIRYLSALDAPAIPPELAGLKHSKDLGIKSESTIWAARSGDPSAIRDMANLFGSDTFSVLNSTVAASSDQVLKAYEDASLVLFDIARTSNTEAAKALLPLLSNDTLRASVTTAIRNFHDPGTFPNMVALLNDHDPSVEYDALMTMCETVYHHRPGCPSYSTFREHRRADIREWEKWWKENQNGIKK